MRIFVSYRRETGSYQTGRLCDRLVARFGRDQVFHDTQSIPLGGDFREVIRREITASQVLLIVIVEGWLEAADAAGKRRLDDPGDYVRFEVATALASGLRVIPLLFGRAVMPTPEQLPDDLKELAFRNGQQIQPDPHFHDDVNRLIEHLERAAPAVDGEADAVVVPAPPPPPSDPVGGSRPARRRLTRRRVLLLSASLLAAGAAALGTWAWVNRVNPLIEMRRSEIEREVAAARAEPQVLIRERSPGYHESDLVPPASVVGVDILVNRWTYDLRGWKDVPPDKLGEFVSAVTMTRRVQLKKTAATGRFEIQGRTSGLDLFWSSFGAFPFTVEAQKGDVFVGTDRMKLRKMVIDVSSVPVGQEFTLSAVGTYWNSCQTESEQWFGLLGYERSFAASMLVLFPADKPFRKFELTVARTAKDVPVPFDGTRIVLTGGLHDWIYWEVPKPREGYVYRLHWKW